MISWKHSMVIAIACLLAASHGKAQQPLEVLQAFYAAHAQQSFYAYTVEVKQYDGEHQELGNIKYKVLCDNNGRTLIQFADGSEQLRTAEYSIRIGHAEKRFILEPAAGQSLQEQWSESMASLEKAEDVTMKTKNGTHTVSYQTEAEGQLQKGSISFNPATTEMIQSIITVKGDISGNGSAETVKYVVNYASIPWSDALKAQLMEPYVQIKQKDIQPTDKFNDYEVISTL